MKPLFIALLEEVGFKHFQIAQGGRVKARLTSDGFTKWLQFRQEQMKKPTAPTVSFNQNK